jgi:hypothetical protein
VPARPYAGIEIGYYAVQISNVEILDTVLENGATAAISWQGSGTKSNIRVGTTLNLQSVYSDGSIAPGSAVSIYDAAGDLIYQGTTGSNGVLSGITVIADTYAQTGTDPTAITTTASGPLTIQVTNGTKKTSLIVNPPTGEVVSIVATIS